MRVVDDLTIIAERLACATSFQEAATVLTLWAREVTGCEEAHVRMVEGEAGDRWAAVCRFVGAGPEFSRDEAVVEAGECFCGRVASGEVDSDLPGFSSGGSFVWGHLSDLEKTLGPDSPIELRGRCKIEGFESVAVFPISAEDGPIGSLHLGDRRTDRFQGHIGLLEAAGRLAGPVLLQYRPAEREGAMVGAVRSSLLPEKPLVPAGIEAGAAFSAAGEMSLLGGDFYDLLDLGDGVTLALVGDYSGKGLQAAGMATRARYVLANRPERATDPAGLLGSANDVLSKTIPPDRFVTVAACRIDSRSGGMTLCLAGHPAPAILGTGRGHGLLAPPNLPLGIVPGYVYREAEHALRPGEVLLLYTDGISESRSGAALFGLEGISRVWNSRRWDDLDELAQAICEEAAAFQDPALAADDRLVLALRLA